MCVVESFLDYILKVCKRLHLSVHYPTTWHKSVPQTCLLLLVPNAVFFVLVLLLLLYTIVHTDLQPVKTNPFPEFGRVYR